METFIETKNVSIQGKTLQTCVEIIKTHSLQLLQTRGTILSKRMNVLVLA